MTKPLHFITVRRLLAANRARVFDAFSRSDALVQWFKPSTNISIEVLAFEFTEGGRYRLRYTMPDGACPVLGGTYERIRPPMEIAFTWVWEAPDIHAHTPTRVSVQLLEKGEDTEIVLIHQKLETEEMRTRHAAGWEATLDSLEDALAADEKTTEAEKTS